MDISTKNGQLPVGAIARSPVRSIDPNATLRGAARALHEANIGTLVVLDGPEITGIVSERDLVTALAQGADPDHHLVTAVMHREPRYVTGTESIAAAIEVMNRVGVRHLPVVDEGELVGIVSLRDLTFALADRHRDARGG